jgi:hypothetical protein
VNSRVRNGTRFFCLRGLLEVIMTNLLQRGDDAAQQRNVLQRRDCRRTADQALKTRKCLD